MAEKISRDQVRKTAQLGRILLEETELESFTSQLGEILTYVEKLNELDTGHVEPLNHVLPLKNVYRPDASEESIGAELALREAPEHYDLERHDTERDDTERTDEPPQHFFRIPKVLGDGGGA